MKKLQPEIDKGVLQAKKKMRPELQLRKREKSGFDERVNKTL